MLKFFLLFLRLAKVISQGGRLLIDDIVYCTGLGHGDAYGQPVTC